MLLTSHVNNTGEKIAMGNMLFMDKKKKLLTVKLNCEQKKQVIDNSLKCSTVCSRDLDIN